jgi:hypothetical protein
MKTLGYNGPEGVCLAKFHVPRLRIDRAADTGL